ncbi:MAG: S-layer homology domain-containing protein [Acidimicrobiaceae bacterium]|nr:S-layer homology domain-containing protein [Acidimicrobiaceae bacterium]MYE74968.1 S-layer homology domain-containing protein [Acidimicrobiaceae bacterium]MYH42221.1 S-layer homology domain-containing protein [Acidimicrobiaceae bacterium]MYJ42621.1 S-layer homology domain-containing protein [Acidimicrobiaceae bacterium]MYK74480.1 S-layer homology domain-containing protein [Acidimicrobiaceae bacterium]
MKKRAVAVIACVVAAVVAVPGSTAIAQSQRFPDVPPDHYAFEAIEWAAEAGVAAGYTDGTFKPQQPLSKRHAVVFMERYYDEILQADQSEDFTRGDMMVLLKAINDGTLRDTGTDKLPPPGEDSDDAFLNDYVTIEHSTEQGVSWWERPRGELRVKIHVCAQSGFEHLLSASDLTTYAAAANEQIAPCYAWQSSGLLTGRFEAGQIVKSDILARKSGWGSAIAPSDCFVVESNHRQTRIVHHYLVYAEDWSPLLEVGGWWVVVAAPLTCMIPRA